MQGTTSVLSRPTYPMGVKVYSPCFRGNISVVQTPDIAPNTLNPKTEVLLRKVRNFEVVKLIYSQRQQRSGECSSVSISKSVWPLCLWFLFIISFIKNVSVSISRKKIANHRLSLPLQGLEVRMFNEQGSSTKPKTLTLPTARLTPKTWQNKTP